MSPSSLHLGIDENGLGPRLGPLVVTAVAARTTAKGAQVVSGRARGVLAERIGDSKKLVSFSDSVLGEAWARLLSPTPPAGEDTPDGLIRALSIDGRADLERPCPEDHKSQCWATDGESYASEEPLRRRLMRDLDGLRKKGVDVLGARTVVVCTQRLNEAASRGITRFQSDLFAMERLILHMHERYGCEVHATCGKVGGYNRYPAAFGPLAGRLFTTLEEGRARSEYQLAALGRVAFVRDADADHLLVSLASLVGKWVRDHLTRRVTRYHRAHDPSLPEVSGYHDPVTTRFIAASALARRTRGVLDACFERRAVSVEGLDR